MSLTKMKMSHGRWLASWTPYRNWYPRLLWAQNKDHVRCAAHDIVFELIWPTSVIWNLLIKLFYGRCNGACMIPVSFPWIHIQIFSKVLFGGDQLTAERARGAQRSRRSELQPKEQLRGLIPVATDWHAKQCLLQVCIHLLYHYIYIVLVTRTI